LNALVVVVDGDRKLLLGGILANDVLVQILLQFEWLRKLVGGAIRLLVLIILEDRIAYGDALVADVGAGIITGGRD